MIKWLIRRKLAAFERTFGYDISYAREILDTDLGAFMGFAKLQGLRWHKDAPLDLLYGAKLTAVIAQDCGPCAQLNVAMALADGVDPKIIANIAEGTDALMTEPARLGARFARAVEARSPEADEIREEIARRWGQRAVISLAFGIASAGVYPAIKYALGHGKACQRLQVAGETIVPRAKLVAVA